MSDALLEARLRLALVPGLGPILTRRLEETFGGPVEVCAAPASHLAQVQGIGPRKSETIRRALDEADPRKELALAAEHDARIVAIDDVAYPALLRHIPDPPQVLYVCGQLSASDSVGLAVVGSRKCTAYGREQADRLAALCATAGLTIVSGGARGIDGAAHHAALRAGGRTIAVLGSGLAKPYPAEHAPLFKQIADGHGAVVSELPMTAPPVAENFPRRNRIISGLSLGVLVVEAAVRSGALITARLAAEEHHREVMCVPGRVDSIASAGCHKAIREGWATLVTNPAEILDCLGEAGQTLKAALSPTASGNGSSATPRTQPMPDGDAGRLFAAIPADSIDIDRLCQVTNLPISAIQAHLMQLQLTGLIERQPGNKVRRRKGQ